jgi:hypothetical protein
MLNRFLDLSKHVRIQLGDIGAAPTKETE